MIFWGWGHRGKGDHSRLPATKLGMRLGVLDLRSGRRGAGCLQPTCRPGRNGSWASRGANWSLGLGQSKKREAGGDGL